MTNTAVSGSWKQPSQLSTFPLPSGEPTSGPTWWHKLKEMLAENHPHGPYDNSGPTVTASEGLSAVHLPQPLCHVPLQGARQPSQHP